MKNWQVVLATVIVSCIVVPAEAGVTTTGDVTPDPTTTTSSDNLYIANTADGSMTIDAGSDVDNGEAYVGKESGTTGTVTVSGSGSTWDTHSVMWLGRAGTGVLNVEDGGHVWAVNCDIGSLSGSTGIATVSDASSRLSPYNLTVGFYGTGTLYVQNGAEAYSSNDIMIGHLAGSIGTATITGNGSSLGTNVGILVGYEGTGTLNIENGAALSNTGNDVYLGRCAGANGTVTVAGIGSTWDNDYRLYVGYEGAGTLSIENGGTVANSWGYLGWSSGAAGTVTVTGPGSTWTNSLPLYVGYDGGGTLTIQNGGTVTGGSGSVGHRVGSTGTATVTGSGSTWDCSSLTVGSSGSGTLNIENGGAVNVVYSASVGLYSSGNGSITFNNGMLNTGGLMAAPDELLGTGVINTTGLLSDIALVFDNNNPLQQQIILNSEPEQNIAINVDQDFVGAPTGVLGAGYRGQGSLTVADGRAVRSQNGYLGYHSGSTGTATITGGGSGWTNASLYVGYDGNGTLNIQNGGVVSSFIAAVGCWTGATGTATVTGTGSAWNISGDLYVGPMGTGTLNIQNGGEVAVGGNLSINSLSTLDILLASLADPLLDVAGNATLDGTLSVDLAEGFTLTQGDLFTLIDLTDVSKTVTGTFAGLAEGTSVGNFGGLDLLISYVGGDGNDVTLSAVPEPATLALMLLGGLLIWRRY